jgi:hypothetical protein
MLSFGTALVLIFLVPWEALDIAVVCGRGVRVDSRVFDSCMRHIIYQIILIFASEGRTALLGVTAFICSLLETVQLVALNLLVVSRRSGPLLVLPAIRTCEAFFTGRNFTAASLVVGAVFGLVAFNELTFSGMRPFLH